MTQSKFKGPLHEMAETTQTEFWNDSCAVAELRHAIENGAVGATSNPVIVGEVLKKELAEWTGPIKRIIAAMPSATEDEITWKLIEEISTRGAKLLEPIHSASGGRRGRLSVQTDPRCYRDAARMIQQAVRFDALAPNIIVKIPVTAAGVEAIEEATFRGISINATVSFSVPQTMAVAEAVERGMRRREAGGLETGHMGPVCTLMVGRLDDWLKQVVRRDDLVIDPAHLEWAGVAVMKRAYRLYQERGYRTRLLSAATRNHMHWSEFIGGNVVVTLTHSWQKRFNRSAIAVMHRMDTPVDDRIVQSLQAHFEEFRRAYDPEGMDAKDFDAFGATRRTLRSFIEGYHELVSMIRDFMIEDPDR